jgi:hypothetical protein
MTDETHHEDPRAISEVLIDLKETLPEEKVCTFDILEALHERGFGFLLFIFALPAAIPLPALGINTLIALPLFFLTTQQMLGRHSVWIPEKIKYKSISKSFFEKVVAKALPYLEKIEYLLKPRLGFITGGVFSNLIGLVGLILTISITIPLPLTNTVPAMGIALMALGVIMRDGLAVIVGATVGLLWVAMLVYVSLFLGMEGLDLIKETIKSWV